MKSSQGVVFKRRQNILKALQEKRVILVEDLAKELDVSGDNHQTRFAEL